MTSFCDCSIWCMCWGQLGCLSLSAIILLWVLWSIIKHKICKQCNHPSEIALRKYHTSFWNNDDEISNLMLNALRMIKRSQNVSEVYYFQYNENGILKLVASSQDKNISDQDSEVELSLLKKHKTFYQNKRERISVSFGSSKKIAFIFPINVDGYDIGQICLIFDKNKAPEQIIEDDVINLVTGLLKYREKSGILEDALGRCESDLDTIMNAASHGVVIIDKDLKIRRLNNIAEQMFGCRSEMCQNEHLMKFLRLEDQTKQSVISDLINEAIKKGSFVNKKERFVIKSKDESEFVVCFRTAPVFGINGVEGAALIICDVRAEEIIETERNQRKEEKAKHYLELQMEQEQRREVEKALIKSGALASTGTLVAGIAHEYNNVNSIAMGNLDVLLQMKNLPDFVKDSLKTIRGMMSRGSEITTELLDYTRNNHTNGNKREYVSLIDIAEKTKKMVGKEFAVEGIEFSSNFENIKEKDLDKYIVFVDPSRIQQVILNLVLNARHAMIESHKKIVSFEVGVENDSAYLKVSDTGHGIPEEDLSKLFNPYFSTKGVYAKFESQKQFSGNGLGLAICTLIMKKNGGSIDVKSKVGEGTTFTLRFDEVQKDSLEIENHEVEDEEENFEIKDGQGKKILVLDDEIELCKLLEHMFSGHGYKIKYTDDGYEGLRMHKEDPFDLIITDIQMPKMTGLEFLNNLSSIGGPQPKKVVMTGRITKQETVDIELDEFMHKPFDLIRFMSTIQGLLNL